MKQYGLSLLTFLGVCVLGLVLWAALVEGARFIVALIAARVLR